jgi:c-di-GMP-binding flagellar brake protein YcgR
MENELTYSLSGSSQILSHLMLLFKSKCILSAHLGDGHDSFLTTIIEIDKKNNTIILDYGPKEYLNIQLINTDKTFFRTEYEGIKVSFAGTSITKVRHDGEWAFVMPLPKSILWLQRREFYRVRSPIAKYSYCEIFLPEQEPIKLNIYDISVSGFSMLTYSVPLAAELLELKHFKNCKLVLTDVGEGKISFDVLYTCVINPPKLNKIEKLGCKFTDIDRAFDSTIQRYMQQIERENLLKD